MKWTKKLCAVVLALSICLAAGISAAAAPADTPEARWSTDGGGWSEGTLIDAIWAVYSADQTAEIQLMRDVTLESSWYPQTLGIDGVSLVLNGQGFTINRGGATSLLFILNQPNTNIVLKNITIDGGAIWNDAANVSGRTNSGQSVSGNSHLILVNDDTATLTLDAGTVLQNNHMASSTLNGAGIAVSAGKLIMKDGASVKHNTAAGNGAYGGGGGGINVSGTGVFSMEGGTISGNYASVAGGGVFVGSGATFDMIGGQITANAAGNNSGGIGGNAGYHISLLGGTVAENTAAAAGGILLWSDISVGKAIQIKNNTAAGGAAANVVLYQTNKLNLVQAFTDQAQLMVSKYGGVSNDAVALEGTDQDLVIPAKVFVSSDTAGFTLKRQGNQLMFTDAAPTYTVLFATADGSAVEPLEDLTTGSLLQPVASSLSHHMFAGWYTDAALTHAWNFETSQVQSNMVLYAKFDKDTHTVRFETNGGNTVADCTVTCGSAIDQPTDPVRTGYLFKGWYTDSGLSHTYDFSTAVESDFTLYAKWEQQNTTQTSTPESTVPPTGESFQPWGAAAVFALLLAGGAIVLNYKKRDNV